MNKLKILLLGAFLILAGCASTYYYGVHSINEVTIEEVDNGYDVEFTVHVGKDATYYTVDYYVDDVLLERTYTTVDAPMRANYSVGYRERIFVSERVNIKVIITSRIGDEYSLTDPQEFEIRM